jgi:hypothetical protein
MSRIIVIIIHVIYNSFIFIFLFIIENIKINFLTFEIILYLIQSVITLIMTIKIILDNFIYEYYYKLTTYEIDKIGISIIYFSIRNASSHFHFNTS